MYRHGDVYLIPAEQAKTINPQFRIQEVVEDKDGKHILAYGEASGHYHAVTGANIVAESGGLVLEIGEEGGVLQHLGYPGHKEHADISLPPGKYVPVQQHEYDIVQGWRQVVD